MPRFRANKTAPMSFRRIFSIFVSPLLSTCKIAAHNKHDRFPAKSSGFQYLPSGLFTSNIVFVCFSVCCCLRLFWLACTNPPYSLLCGFRHANQPLMYAEVRGITNRKTVLEGYENVQAALLDYTLTCYPSVVVSPRSLDASNNPRIGLGTAMVTTLRETDCVRRPIHFFRRLAVTQ